MHTKRRNFTRFIPLIFALIFGLVFGRNACALADEISPHAALSPPDSPDIFEIARSGDVAQLADAIANGANVSAIRANSRLTPLHLAANANPDPAICELLLANGANVNATESNGWTPLFVAVAGGNDRKLAIIKTLLAHGAQIDLPSNLGWTPLYAAISGNRPLEIIQALIAAGANVNAIAPLEEMNNVAAMTFLHAAIMLNRDPQTLTALLAAGANVNARNAEKLTPLHLAALARRNSEVIRVLIAYGAEVNAKNDNGDTPLDAALTVLNLAAAKIISDAGGQLGDPADAKNAADIMRGGLEAPDFDFDE